MSKVKDFPMNMVLLIIVTSLFLFICLNYIIYSILFLYLLPISVTKYLKKLKGMI
jgi:hypothetical protein